MKKYGLVLLLLLGVYSYWALTKPLPLLKPEFSAKQLTVPAPGSHLTWPAGGQSAVGIVGTDILETNGVQKPAPTASTAKIITALVTLQRYPLQAGQQGPVITLTNADVLLYQKYAAADGSLLPVKAGEKLSEYQMLQAMLLPSANNIADSLAIWAFGSLKNYSLAANGFLAQNGLSHTRVGSDASGLSPTTTSTAGDLVKLGKLVMGNPVLTNIVSQKTAAGFPLAPSIKNVNFLLGTQNIIGIKTGNSDQAGGVFLSASKVTINQKPVTIVTAYMKSKDLFSALKFSLPLIKSAQANFQTVQAVKAGTVVGHYTVPWGGKIDAFAAKNLKTTAWKGKPNLLSVQLNPVDRTQNAAGSIILPAFALTTSQTVQVNLLSQPAPPSAWWRLTHPFQR